ncbi:MAG TPA: hypothetical protein VLL52_05590, partial [Anaerolineae bacterium]|nr:hypothetical protein [Anaerolineae bacterium]
MPSKINWLAKLRYLIIFILIIILINQILLQFLPPIWDNKPIQQKYAHFQQGNYNTLFIGSSRTFRQISPAIINTHTNISFPINAYNLGSDGYLLPESSALWATLLETKPTNLCYLFYELSFDSSYIPTNIYWSHWSSIQALQHNLRLNEPNHIQRWQKSNQYTLLWLEKQFNIGQIEPLLMHYVYNPPVELETNEHGYTPLNTERMRIAQGRQDFLDNPQTLAEQTAHILAEWQQSTTQPITQHPDYVFNDMIQSMLTSAHQHNIHLIFILPPRYYTPIINTIPATNKINLSHPEEYP